MLLTALEERVHSLADLQARIARATTTGAPVVAQLVGGAVPARRLDIHLRHYETSLTAALRDKFPACVWLAGTELVEAAARAYVHEHPPRRPCIAEYGGDFPRFLASYGRAPELPYLRSFATLERAIAQVSIAIDHAPLPWAELARFETAQLVDSALRLQPGLTYLHSSWPVDELMTIYMTGDAPERFVLAATDTRIEVRGARGNVRLSRLDAASFAFHAALAAGRSIGDAADLALGCDVSFDPGAALRRLVAAGLAVAITGVAPGAT